MRTFTTTADYLDRLIIRAGVLDVRIETAPDLTEAVLELTGPDELLSQATVERTATRWVVEVPSPEPAVVNTGRGVAMAAGNITAGGSVVFVGGDVHVGPGTVITGGRTVTATLRLPAGVDLEVPWLRAGSVRARGFYGQVFFDSTNADLDLERAVFVDAETTNGDITVGGALESLEAASTNGDIDLEGTAPTTRVRSTNGDIDIAASGAHRIRARATNGDVTVRRNGHTDAQINADTTNGRERIR